MPFFSAVKLAIFTWLYTELTHFQKQLEVATRRKKKKACHSIVGVIFQHWRLQLIQRAKIPVSDE